MIKAVSLAHHEFIDAGLWFGDSNHYDTLILHNERGVFMQIRVGPHWMEVCRHCGATVTVGRGYCCTQCLRSLIAAAMEKR